MHRVVIQDVAGDSLDFGDVLLDVVQIDSFRHRGSWAYVGAVPGGVESRLADRTGRQQAHNGNGSDSIRSRSDLKYGEISPHRDITTPLRHSRHSACLPRLYARARDPAPAVETGVALCGQPCRMRGDISHRRRDAEVAGMPNSVRT